MSIKEEFEKNQTNDIKGKPKKDIGEGLIKVEIKDGHIEASSQLNVPKDTLVMVLIVMEALQRAIVENDTKLYEILNSLRKINNKEIIKLIKDNAEILKAGPDASDND